MSDQRKGRISSRRADPPRKRERPPEFPRFSDAKYTLNASNDGSSGGGGNGEDLGQGRTSRVKRATHTETGKRFAVKIFKPEPGEARKYYERHANNELNVLRKLGPHPGIVALVEKQLLSNEHGDLHMVMEIATWDWSSFIRSRHSHTVPLGQLKGWIAQAIQALAYCHHRHVVHRDIKPENVLITDRNQVKLCDFGLASTEMWHYPKHTHEVTTLWQRAPEVLVCQGLYDEKLDIWSLGMTFIELLTHKPLIKGHNEKDQLRQIYSVCGTPKVHEWPSAVAKLLRDSYTVELRYDLPGRLMRHASDQGRSRFMEADARDFFELMLVLNPEKRAIASQLLRAEYLTTKTPLPYPIASMIAYNNK